MSVGVRPGLGHLVAACLAAAAFGWPPGPAAAGPDPTENLAARLTARTDLVDIATVAPRVRVALAYSTADNFLGRDVYGELDACFLNRDAARMLAAADRDLAERRPDLRLLVYDCVRPLSVQRAMWKLVAGTPKQPYVGNPTGRRRSLHNLGCAVDLTLADADGAALDMGSAFDQFDELSQPRLERRLLREKRLSPAHVANRRVLRAVMTAAGFRGIGNEWWHFACTSAKGARKAYRVVD